MSNRYRAAIFDMDGLLIDSERVIMGAWLKAAADAGVPIDAEGFVECIGRAAAESDAILVRLLGSRDLFERTRLRAREMLEEQADSQSETPLFPLKPGARDLLATLRAAGVPCAVASSSSVDEILHRLGAVDVLSFFQAVAGGNEVARGKPDPALYLLAASRLGAAPIDCLAFEDSENGARAAQAAGIRVFIVPDLRPPSPAVAAASEGVLRSLAEAVDQVPAWFGPTRSPTPSAP